MHKDRQFRLIPAILKRIVIVLVVVNIAAPIMVVVIPLVTRDPDQDAAAVVDSTNKVTTRQLRSSHDSTVDHLLPEGVGGTVVVASLPGDHAGEAHSRSALILLAADPLSRADPAAVAEVEIHERGHLIDAAYPALVERLLTAVPAPDPQAYAAKNGGEHFAEMLGQAWGLLDAQERDDICIDVRDATIKQERRVPGTAGALVWFIPTWERLRGQPVDSLFGPLADSLSRPYLDKWQPIIAAVERRRSPDGRFEPWPEISGKLGLIKVQVAMTESSSVLERVVGWMLLPAATVARRL